MYANFAAIIRIGIPPWDVRISSFVMRVFVALQKHTRISAQTPLTSPPQFALWAKSWQTAGKAKKAGCTKIQYKVCAIRQ
jgi:hypothetical protein